MLMIHFYMFFSNTFNDIWRICKGEFIEIKRERHIKDVDKTLTEHVIQSRKQRKRGQGRGAKYRFKFK